ncbi:MAG TPA: class I SAM-dependent methyltransferase [Deltaproteobacteria bacterium]|nr:class I SAM-dependent methyltransferase [Deltaproteobacteria bacterium]HQI81390.1 class I SAM-dependent methyltransferase [Deltaproteobacteria bacterium]
MLIFVEERFLPSRDQEEARYRMHRNTGEDSGYVAFLNQAVEAALSFLKPGMKGMDFGCGPVPTLSTLLEKCGMRCGNYDPLFFPRVPEGPHDFIFATECFEHFFSPDRELLKIKALLAPGGILTIMTEPWTCLDGFSTWPYARDATHVCFYHDRTMDWISEKYGFHRMPSCNARVSVMKSRDL